MSEVHRIDPQRFAAREIDGELVILDLETQRYLRGNRTAAELWPLLVEGTTEQELVSRLHEARGVSRERAARDVASFLRTLEE